MQRLKGEWEEAAAAAMAVKKGRGGGGNKVSANTVGVRVAGEARVGEAAGHAAYKAPPSLRLRRRPGKA